MSASQPQPSSSSRKVEITLGKQENPSILRNLRSVQDQDPNQKDKKKKKPKRVRIRKTVEVANRKRTRDAMETDDGPTEEQKEEVRRKMVEALAKLPNIPQPKPKPKPKPGLPATHKKRALIKKQASPKHADDKKPKKENSERPRKKRRLDKKTNKKSKILMMIQRYQSSPRFKDYLEDFGVNYTGREMQHMTIEELEGALGQIRYLIANRSGGSMLAKAVDLGVVKLENGCRPFINIEGLSAACKNNPEYLDCLEQICVEHDVSVSNPYMRLAWVIANQGVAQYEINRKLPLHPPPLIRQQAVVPESMDVDESAAPPPLVKMQHIPLGAPVPLGAPENSLQV